MIMRSTLIAMRHMLAALLLPFCLTAQPAANATPPAALPLATVLERHVAALGPLGTIQSRRATIRAVGIVPFDLPIVTEAQRPNLLRKEVNIQGSIQITGFDGTDAWRIDPFVPGGTKPMDLPAAELAELLEESDFDGPLVNAAAKGHRVEYAGPAVMTDSGRSFPVHVVRLHVKNGGASTVYLDATTFLERKRVLVRPVMGRDTEMEIFARDYRTISGIPVPHLMEIVVKGLPQPSRLIIERVELNVSLDRARFTRSGATRK